jgi:hypothetical protein
MGHWSCLSGRELTQHVQDEVLGSILSPEKNTHIYMIREWESDGEKQDRERKRESGLGGLYLKIDQSGNASLRDDIWTKTLRKWRRKPCRYLGATTSQAEGMQGQRFWQEYPRCVWGISSKETRVAKGGWGIKGEELERMLSKMVARLSSRILWVIQKPWRNLSTGW